MNFPGLKLWLQHPSDPLFHHLWSRIRLKILLLHRRKGRPTEGCNGMFGITRWGIARF